MVEKRYVANEAEILKSEVWIGKIIPLLIFLFLWLDGWFFPLILLPVLYVLLVEKKSLKWLGFSRHELKVSMLLSAIITLTLGAMYYSIFLYYRFIMDRITITVYNVFLDVAWYPAYEELAYRGFALTHFADPHGSYLSRRNLPVNLIQSLLFLSIHRHHFGKPLLLIAVFILGFLNGLLFLKTRNLCGCVFSHSTLNGFALLLRYLSA